MKTIILLVFLLTPCFQSKSVGDPIIETSKTEWTYDSLEKRALDQMNSAKWNKDLINQDLDNYTKYQEIFQSYPLNKSPFPVADYDFAVSKIPFDIEDGNVFFKDLDHWRICG